MKPTNQIKPTYLLSLIIVVLLALVWPAPSEAQDIIRRIYADKKVVSDGKNSNYVILDDGGYYLVFNKNNTLMLKDSRYLETFQREGSSLAKLNDNSLLDSLLIKLIGPKIITYKPKVYSEDIVRIYITLYSALDGKVCEMHYGFPNDAGIPIEAIDSLEKAIHNAGFKLVFDPNIRSIKGSVWVWSEHRYSILQIKQMLEKRSN